MIPTTHCNTSVETSSNDIRMHARPKGLTSSQHLGGDTSPTISLLVLESQRVCINLTVTFNKKWRQHHGLRSQILFFILLLVYSINLIFHKILLFFSIWLPLIITYLLPTSTPFGFRRLRHHPFQIFVWDSSLVIKRPQTTTDSLTNQQTCCNQSLLKQ